MMQDTEWKQGKSVRGENILELAGDAEDLLSVVLCMKKLKGETKTDNMPTVNKEMTEWRHTQHGIMGAAVSEVCSGEGRAGDGLERGVRSWLDSMQIDILKSAAIFINKRKRWWKWLVPAFSYRECNLCTCDKELILFPPLCCFFFYLCITSARRHWSGRHMFTSKHTKLYGVVVKIRREMDSQAKILTSFVRQHFL